MIVWDALRHGGTAFMVLGTAASAVVFGAAALLARRRLGWVSSLALCGLLWWLLVIALVTLVSQRTPGYDLPSYLGPDQCNFDIDGPAPEGFWVFSGGQRLLNTVLFVPAGVLLMLSVVKWRRSWLWAPVGLLLLIGFSCGIEYAQRAAWELGRACDITDVIDNGAGAAVGVLLGALASFLVQAWRGHVGRRRAAG